MTRNLIKAATAIETAVAVSTTLLATVFMLAVVLPRIAPALMA